MPVVLGIWGYGAVIALYVYLCRAAGRLITPAVFAVIFMHPPSRRNGIPWFFLALSKALAWPAVLGVWLANGRPASPVLFGPAAAVKLGIDPDSLTPATNAFATMWKSPPAKV